MKLIGYLVFIAVIDAGRIVPYTSDVFGVLIAMAAGLLIMLRRAEEDRLPFMEAVAEIGLAGLAGFIAHAVALTEIENPRMVWVLCALAGIGGSKFVEKLCEQAHGVKGKVQRRGDDES